MDMGATPPGGTMSTMTSVPMAGWMRVAKRQPLTLISRSSASTASGSLPMRTLTANPTGMRVCLRLLDNAPDFELTRKHPRGDDDARKDQRHEAVSVLEEIQPQSAGGVNNA